MSKLIKSLYTESTNLKSKTIAIQKVFDRQLTPEVEDSSDNVNIEEIISETEEKARLLLQEAEEKAREIVDKAEANAQAIQTQMNEQRMDLELEIEKAVNEGRQHGFDEGVLQGKEAGYQEYLSLINEAQEMIKRAQDDYNQTVEQAEPVILELAVTLCQRVIGSKLETDEELWTSMLHQVMLEVREHENVKVYVHPIWYEQTLHQKAELQRLLSHTEHLYIYPDAGLEENGCIIETKFGRIDATIDNQLKHLKAQLMEKIREA
ncbi:flagellar assembly protein FliH [Halalkalibacter urbisdiaboli]|uniref:flagellar assembly protein FliH n=1 Tax=Halalkalibacter urbisdiaboli TaxID=1960589 RepID=UPI0013FE4196|nr:flagellar assembly protein FliH [Halalkalibacter urbisdiaboli]